MIGEVCLGSILKAMVKALKIHMLDNCHHSIFKLCTISMCVKETQPNFDRPGKSPESLLEQTVFNMTQQHNRLVPSWEDLLFLIIMERDVEKDNTNIWVTPFPFREPQQCFPNNKDQVVKRFASLEQNFKRKPEMAAQYVDFMEKIFVKGHTELEPVREQNEGCWYLQSFGVYHPRKPDEIKVVFNSCSQYSVSIS